MKNPAETIALLVGEPGGTRRTAGQFIEGAQRLTRCADGHMRLETVDSAEEFDRIARTTGCFRRGTPIRDPATREIIGYELEEVPLLRAAAALS
jgi:hypothetical protein